ncbi:hypothetical protein Tco_0748776 [Tanacetum coccineum]|uniref:Uncharacterized protein n=1 Tax=Tanacetum coccineum TaxID=301880 RepID=A0ABQ4YXJ0_9ASTR
MDNLLLHNLKTMFEHHVEDNVWKNQQGLVKVLNWKLYDSCGVHCVTMQSMLFYLLVEKIYPLTNHTLHQMFNDVKLQVDYECEMAFELLRLVKKQLKKGYVPAQESMKCLEASSCLLEVTVVKLMLLVYKLLLLVLKVNAASTKVTTAQRLRLLKEFLLILKKCSDGLDANSLINDETNDENAAKDTTNNKNDDAEAASTSDPYAASNSTHLVGY